MSIGDRLRAIRHSWNFSADEMAKQNGVSRRTWESYERNESAPKSTVLEALVAKGIGPNWLLTGEGTMRRGVKDAEGEGANTWLMSRVVDGIQRTYKEVGASLPPASLGELAARIHNEIVQLEGGEDVWRGALALALGRLKAELTEAATTGAGKSSASF